MSSQLLQFTKHLIPTLQNKSIEEVKAYYAERNNALAEILNRPEIPKHLKGLPREQALLKITGSAAIYSILIVGLNEALTTGNMQILNNAVFTYNRLRLYRSLLLVTGTDHSANWIFAIESFAGMDMKVINKAFPKEKGLTSKGHIFCVTFSNLIISFLHQNAQWLNPSVELAKKYLAKKESLFDKSMISYLLALHEQNIEAIIDNLAVISKLYGKAKSIHEYSNPVYKGFGLTIHGLYNLAQYVLPSEVFDRIPFPKTEVFITEFAEYQKSSDYSCGEPFFVFDGEISSLNSLILSF